MHRPSGRATNEMRNVSFELNVNKFAEGSCLVKFGDTHVLCLATIEDRVPTWMRNSNRGWVTAEYGMLPRSTGARIDREAARGKQTGRTQEIQRLIGRSLRAATDLEKLGKIQIKIDCDVIQADGGTRTASITGGYVALHIALQNLVDIGVIDKIPIIDNVAAISCGIYKGIPVLDLEYEEDSVAEADSNFVFTGEGKVVEIQSTAEDSAFNEKEFHELMSLAKEGIKQLVKLQNRALKLD